MLVRAIALSVLVLSMTGCQNRADRPLVIAHRGASGTYPEHSLVSYAAAAGMRADMLEPDVVASRDGVLLCSHDLTLEEKTNIADLYPGRDRDGHWHAIDFTADELADVDRKKGDTVWPGVRLVTLDQMLAFVAARNAQRDAPGFIVIPELKSPTLHAEHGIDTPVLILELLRKHGFGPQQAMIQCFEADTVRRMKHDLACPYPLLYLVGAEMSQAELEEAATFADGIGPSRKLIERDPGFVQRCHALGLLVYPYTYNDEADAVREAAAMGVDGLFTNYPDRTREALGG